MKQVIYNETEKISLTDLVLLLVSAGTGDGAIVKSQPTLHCTLRWKEEGRRKEEDGEDTK